MLLIVIAQYACELHNRGKRAVIMANSRWIKNNDWNVFRRLRLPLPSERPAKIAPRPPHSILAGLPYTN